MIELLTNPIILRALAAILLAATFFPLAGVFVIRLNLLPLRFMLMHAAFFGAAAALALGIWPMAGIVPANLLAVLLIIHLKRRSRIDLGHSSLFVMVFSIALAFIVIYRLRIPAKDTLALLWGSPFTVSYEDLAVLAAIAFLLAAFTWGQKKYLPAVFVNTQAAAAAGLKVNRLENSAVFLSGLTVAAAMPLLGAMLLDSLVLIPAIVAAGWAGSFKSYLRWTMICGLSTGLAGFFLALSLDLPLSAAVAFCAGIVLLLSRILVKK